MGTIAGKPTSYRTRATLPQTLAGAPVHEGTPPDARRTVGSVRVLATVLAGASAEAGNPPEPVFREVDYAFAGGRCLIGARIDFVRESRAAHGAGAAWCRACAPGVAAAQLETGAVAPASAGADVGLLLGDAGMRVVSEFLKWQTGGGSAHGAHAPAPAPDAAAQAGDAAMPQRSAVLLARERAGVLLLTSALLGPRVGRAEAVDAVKALAATQAPRRYLGAFLAGRCAPADPDDERRLVRSLEQAATWSPQPDVAIEAAMSLVLRGRQQRGYDALQELLASSRPMGDQYKAAFYLAQFGDPSGYGALLAALRGPLAHYRLMAMRHLIAFLPFDGQLVDGRRVDVEAVLAERLTDPEPLVRAEAMSCLIELRAAA